MKWIRAFAFVMIILVFVVCIFGSLIGAAFLIDGKDFPVWLEVIFAIVAIGGLTYCAKSIMEV